MTDALSFVDVSKRYGRGRRATTALDGVTWSIPVGARACLLGPNGAGKSTSIRLLQGALQPTTGSVMLLGARVGSAAYWEARRRTGIVPQGPGMYRDLTVREYLALARRLYGTGDVDTALAQLGLHEHAGKFLLQLSGGLQRRVSLAVALLPAPDVLLLDEPTVGLDPVAAHEVHAALREAMAGRTVLLCTHTLAGAEALCEDVIILRAGRVLVHESLGALRRRATPRLMLRARQGPGALADALRARGLTSRSEEGGDAVYVALAEPEAEAPALLRVLLEGGLDVYECRPARPTLEELFLNAVLDERRAAAGDGQPGMPT
ncbi:MAG TPA: ABC transporter ATP-binding protein [Chloroflexota bacterium]|nr:ABC transporter ATP-binding protein [Chloroflexota bacterium]